MPENNPETTLKDIWCQKHPAKRCNSFNPSKCNRQRA